MKMKPCTKCNARDRRAPAAVLADLRALNQQAVAAIRAHHDLNRQMERLEGVHGDEFKAGLAAYRQGNEALRSKLWVVTLEASRTLGAALREREGLCGSCAAREALEAERQEDPT